MEQNEEIKFQLWDYIDGLCSEAQRQRIATLIGSDAGWKRQYNELAALQAGLTQELATEQPSLRFSKNVMEAVAAAHIAPATKKYINLAVIKSIAAFFVITILSILGYAFATANWHTASPALYAGFKSINISSFFSSTFLYAFVMVNIVLGLALGDKVLRRKGDGIE
jgi:hypothetical protein